ncbi:hypothetical protein BC830DRAFT_1113841 [Chytriomyces sp. MP71]|nr:hypothetical protein BC830DRAFT_1113841 [Chytriomyces sp. MP71]
MERDLSPFPFSTLLLKVGSSVWFSCLFTLSLSTLFFAVPLKFACLFSLVVGDSYLFLTRIWQFFPLPAITSSLPLFNVDCGALVWFVLSLKLFLVWSLILPCFVFFFFSCCVFCLFLQLFILGGKA